MLNSVSVQIQRAYNDTISSQVLPQMQNALRARSRPLTQKGWNIPTERPERDTEDKPSQEIWSSSRSEPFRNRSCGEEAGNAHDKAFEEFFA